ncbi:MAG: hypothetical protein ACYDDF_07685 [Thermoplasmatota archaeon]
MLAIVAVIGGAMLLDLGAANLRDLVARERTILLAGGLVGLLLVLSRILLHDTPEAEILAAAYVIGAAVLLVRAGRVQVAPPTEAHGTVRFLRSQVGQTFLQAAIATGGVGVVLGVIVPMVSHIGLP